MRDSHPLLEVNRIKVSYGDVRVLHGVSMEVLRGQVVGLTGRNGAGKTTTLRTIAGLLTPEDGEITFSGAVITGLRPDRIARRGVASVPEYRGVFSHLTVQENLQLVGKGKGGRTLDEILEIFPILQRLLKRKGGHLSGGEQQIVAISRALLTNPSLLLLDEPSQGLAPVIVKDIFASLKTLKEQGVGMLLVEQRLDLTLELSDVIYVIHQGEVAFHGTREEVASNPQLAARYLGVGTSTAGS